MCVGGCIREYLYLYGYCCGVIWCGVSCCWDVHGLCHLSCVVSNNAVSFHLWS